MSISQSVLDNHMSKETASKALRVCCYGSSSASTPETYLQAARDVGYLLGTRKHVCVNGAGSFGCMAALNDGCDQGNGHVVGVIHSMFLVDNSDWMQDRISAAGPHGVFHPKNKANEEGPTRELLVAGGDDLQERKRLLVENADALIVLPGGPGTWDELWEMACAKNIGLTNLPIVCVNVKGYYKPFEQMLQRASDDKLIKIPPRDIIHFADTPMEAVQWIEEQVAKNKAAPANIKKREQVLRKSTSAFNIPPVQEFSRHLSRLFSELTDKDRPWSSILLVGVGVLAGVCASELRRHR